MVYMYLFPSMPEEAEGGDYISPDRGSVVCDSTAVYRPSNAEESILYSAPRWYGPDASCRLAMNGYPNIAHLFDPPGTH